ncbi:MAG: hypothetical protein U9N62_03905, partial [Thermotogota bacterium]|nr:hypothetical protein [Thermotogota bacterium]
IAMVFSMSFSAENSTNGITDDSVKIGTFQALSGGVAFIGVSILYTREAAQACFLYLQKNTFSQYSQIILLKHLS